jgi:spore germination cell wall hydrolase CwlJ-like protein
MKKLLELCKVIAVAFWCLCLAIILAALLTFWSARLAHSTQSWEDDQAGIERDDGRTCLALAEYLEARSDGAAGMREVGRVVLRRLVSGKFGGDICAVALAPGQFEGFEKAPMPRHPEREHEAWALAQAVAEEVLGERFDGDNDAGYCQGALFFSQTARNSALCKVGVHFFYQDNQ